MKEWNLSCNIGHSQIWESVREQTGVERLNFVIAVIGADNFEECLFCVLICDVNGLIGTRRGDFFKSREAKLLGML